MAVFESVRSRRTQRYYIGGISYQSNEAGILQFLESKNIYPESMKLIDTHRGSLAAKLTIYKSDCKAVESQHFWPRRIYCRKWYSVKSWTDMREGNEADYDYSNQ